MSFGIRGKDRDGCFPRHLDLIENGQLKIEKMVSNPSEPAPASHDLASAQRAQSSFSKAGKEMLENNDRETLLP
jgi:hypothetical protein